MALTLMLITNDPDIALEAENAGVNRIFIDLETRGKFERQGHLDTHISNHNFGDIKKVKRVLKKSQILTRINPMYNGTNEEINKAIELGSDVIMLPMFTNAREVEQFIKFIDNRAKTCLLLETPQAFARISDIVNVHGINEIHIGLNDLHLGLGLDFMFEILSCGLIEYMGKIISKRQITWGFGGIARIGEGMLPAEDIIGEHYRLGSKMVILSRSFHNRSNTIQELQGKMDLKMEIDKIRQTEKEIKNWTIDYQEWNRNNVIKKVKEIVK